VILTPKQVANYEKGDDTVADLLETIEFYQSLGTSKSPCGHLERYAYTEDGGKHIVCLLCEREERKEEAYHQAIERDLNS